MSETNLPSSAGFSGRGYLILYQDGAVRSFGNAPSFSFPTNSGAACAIAIQPNGTGLAGITQDGNLLYAGTAPNLVNSLTHNNNFVDLVYNSEGNGLWGLDDHCGVWPAGSANSIGYGNNPSDCIRLAMYSDSGGVVIDKDGHLYRVNTNHDGGSQIHFNNGAVGGGYFPPFQGSDNDKFVLATDQTTVNQVTSVSANWEGELWATLDGGYYPSLPGTADVQADLESGTLLGEFDIVDIAPTPSGNGYWLLVSFRTALNLYPQYTVIAAGDARPAGGTQLGTVKPFDPDHDPVNAIRIISLPAQSGWKDLYLDTITLPALYQTQLSDDNQYGQATGFFDMGYKYALYTPEWVVNNPGAGATGLKLVLPLEYLSSLSTNDFITVSLDLDYSYDTTTQSYAWSLNSGQYQQYQGSSAVSAKTISKLLDIAEDMTETLEELLVELEIISDGTLTPVVTAIEALIIAVDLYEWGSKYFGLLSDSGAVNFPSVAAHAVVRASSCLQPLSGPALDPITSISSSTGPQDFMNTLGALVQVAPTVYQTNIGGDPNYNAWQYALNVESDGSLNPASSPTTIPVTFRVVQPEQSSAHNNGGCVVSTLITINETLQFDAQCALLCHFAKVQGTAPGGGSTQPLTLVGVSGGIAWVSVLGGGTVNTSITPCLLGNPNPVDNSQTLNNTQDILKAVYSLIATGAQNQSNCPTSVGEGLGNFAVQVVQAFINSLGAVGATS